MRPIGGTESRITMAAVKYANTPDETLFALLARGSGIIAEERKGIRRVLRVRGYTLHGANTVLSGPAMPVVAAASATSKAPQSSCCDSPDDPRTCRTCGTYPICKACDDTAVCSYCRPTEEAPCVECGQPSSPNRLRCMRCDVENML
jgi:hypothetical protein